MLKTSEWIVICQKRGYFLRNREWVRSATSAQLYRAYLNDAEEANRSTESVVMFNKAMSEVFSRSDEGFALGPKLDVPKWITQPVVYSNLASVRDWAKRCNKSKRFKDKQFMTSAALYAEYCSDPECSQPVSETAFNEGFQYLYPSRMHASKVYLISAPIGEYPKDTYVDVKVHMDKEVNAWLKKQLDQPSVVNTALSLYSHISPENLKQLLKRDMSTIDQALEWYFRLN